MSLSTQTRKRLPTIKHGLVKGLNREQIGAKCGVTEKTIDRDFKAWVESGEFETWLKEEWIRLHTIIIHEEPIEAYRQLTKLIGYTLTRKIKAEYKEEIKEEIHFKFDELSDDEREFCKRIARNYIKRNDKTRSNSIH